MTLTPFESDLIGWYAAHAPHPAVASQLASAATTGRKYTGAGMYLDLSVPTENCERIPDSVQTPFDGPSISSPAIPNGAGSLLWHEGGRLMCIEAYTYDAPFWKAPSDWRLESG
jgi:hypothetical protein